MTHLPYAPTCLYRTALGGILGALLVTAPAVQAAPTLYDQTSLTSRNDYYTWVVSPNTRISPIAPGNTIGTSPATSISLDATRNTLAIDSLNAAGGRTILHRGVHTTITWSSGDAYYAPGKRFANVVLFTQDQDSGTAAAPLILTPDREVTLTPATRALYAFFTDLDTANNNAGNAVLHITDDQGLDKILPVDARKNAIVVSRVGALSSENLFVANQNNTVTLASGNVVSGGSGDQLESALLVADLANGRGASLVPLSSSTPYFFQPTSSRGALMLIDWGATGDEQGSVVLTVGRPYAQPGVVDQDTVMASRTTDQVWTIRLRDLTTNTGTSRGITIPVHVTGVRAGTRIVIQGALPQYKGFKAGAIRVYAADDQSGPLPRAKGYLKVGNLGIDAPGRETTDQGRWEDLLYNDNNSILALAGGLGSIRSAVPAGTPFQADLLISTPRNSNNDAYADTEYDLIIGIVFAPSTVAASNRVDSSYDNAVDLDAIPIGDQFYSNNGDQPLEFSRDYNWNNGHHGEGNNGNGNGNGGNGVPSGGY